MSSPTATDTGDESAARAGSTPSGNSVLGDVRVNVERWNRKAIHNPTPFLVEVVVAVLSLLLFAAVFGDVGELALQRGGFGDISYVTFLLPAVLMQATIGSSFNSGIGLVDDLQTGMFEKSVVSPMSATAVFAGKVISELLRIVATLLLVVGLAMLLGASIETGLAGVAGLVGICLLVGLLFVAVSNVLGLLTRDEEALNAATMLFMFPLLFLSPAFLPLSSLSPAVETLATVNPVTYGVDAVRALVLGRDTLTVVEVTSFGGIYDTLVPAVAVLAALDLIVGAVAVTLLARASSAEAR